MATTESSSSGVNCASFMDHIMSLDLCLPFLKKFMKIDSSFSHVAKSLSLFKKQEEKYQGVIQLENHILCIKFGLLFLEILLKVSKNKDLKLRIEDVLYDVRLELHLLANTPIEHVYTNLREKLKNVIIRPNTQEYDVIFLDQHSPLMRFCLKRMNEFLLQISGDLLRCKADLITTLIPEIEGIKELLIRLQPLHTYLVVSWASFPLSLVALLEQAACLLYICLVDRMDEETALAMKHNLSDLLKMTDVDQIYLEVLRASPPKRSEHKKLLNPVSDLAFLIQLLACNAGSLQGDLNIQDLAVLRASEPRIFENEKLLNHGSDIVYNMIQLLDCNAGSLQCLNDPSMKLYVKLKFLCTSISGLPPALRSANFNFLVTSIEHVIRKSIPILYSCHVTDMKEDMAKGVNTALSEVLYQIKYIYACGCLRITLYNHPKIGGLSFLDNLLGYMEERFIANPEFNEMMFGEIHAEFDSLLSFLRKIEKQDDEHKELKDLWTSVVGLAYKAKYVLDLLLLGETTLTRHIRLSLLGILKEAELINGEAKNWTYDKEKYHNHPQAQDIAKTPSCVPAQAIEKKSDEIVGFKEDAKKIMDYLRGGQRQLDFISITGMPGIGKTTLANKMYEHQLIVRHFDVRAWCTISQTYQTTGLLKTILGDLVTVADDIKKLITILDENVTVADDKKKDDSVTVADDMEKDKNVLRERFYKILKESNDESKLRECLHKILKERRYLMVFDDIWDKKAWNEMQRCFPDDNNHSRIIITTRDHNVASNIKKRGKVHTLHQLTPAESWELFQKMLKLEESFSEDFVEVGNRIVQSCKGLPLAIVVIARLLANEEMRIHKWNKIARNLSLHMFDSPQSPFMAILEQSYKNLPDHLKSCFLYLGAFPEDAVIPVRKLKQLWIAEGFICNSGTENLEDVAEEYFEDLKSRSLILTAIERSLKGTKACRVHDLLHEFCLKKAKEENFLQWKQKQNSDYFGSEVYDHRLIISNELEQSSSLGVHSLLVFPPWKVESWYVSFICSNFKLLTVLELCVGVMFEDHIDNIGLMIHLRYLSIYMDRGIALLIFNIPSTISSLSNLQYFFWSERTNTNTVTNSTVSHKFVEDSFWKMGKLRHVSIYPDACFKLDHIEKTSGMNNLEKLSTVHFRSREEVACLSRLPKLQKLSCIIDDKDCSWDKSTKFWRFPELDSLHQLVSLKVKFSLYKYKGQRCEFKFPSNLQKLTLSRCPVLWEYISRLGTTLPNLKVLKIEDNYSWEHATWNVNDEDFPQLKFLKLSNLENLCEWNASDDSFPKLKQLVLESCKNLKEIPSCFGESDTLQKIMVKGCGASVKESAKRIQMEQEEMGNELLKLYLS